MCVSLYQGSPQGCCGSYLSLTTLPLPVMVLLKPFVKETFHSPVEENFLNQIKVTIISISNNEIDTLVSRRERWSQIRNNWWRDFESPATKFTEVCCFGIELSKCVRLEAREKRVGNEQLTAWFLCLLEDDTNH